METLRASFRLALNALIILQVLGQKCICIIVSEYLNYDRNKEKNK
jgi:hypothetical protein